MSADARFKVDPRLAWLLGRSYRSSEDAIKELIDNAWDADAENVQVTLPAELSADPIVVQDDGTGMTREEVASIYLSVADDRRSRGGEHTKGKQRKVKGRKGIGKFAGLAAADRMIVETFARGSRTSLEIPRSLLEEGHERHDELGGIPLPVHVEPLEDVTLHGTRITLRHLNQRLHFPNKDKLKALLVLEYGRERELKIVVNGEALDVGDVNGTTTEKTADLPDVGRTRLKFTITEEKVPKRDAGIVLRVDGKVVGSPSRLGLENDKLVPERLLQHVYGEMEADGLDKDDVTADWGRVIENSKAYERLIGWAAPIVRDALYKVHTNEMNLAKARQQKEIDAQIAKLPENRRRVAKDKLTEMAARLYGEKIPEKQISSVISVMVEAFESDEYWTIIQKIEAADKADVATLASALAEFGLIDLAVIGRQARGRRRVLDEIDGLIKNPETTETAVHKIIEKNLWIFNSDYSLLMSNETLGRHLGDVVAPDRKAKRPDLFLAEDFRRRYVLIEFKRPSMDISREHEAQAQGYRDDLCRRYPDWTIDVILIGRGRSRHTSPGTDPPNLKVISYASLVSHARSEIDWLLMQLATPMK